MGSSTKRKKLTAKDLLEMLKEVYMQFSKLLEDFKKLYAQMAANLFKDINTSLRNFLSRKYPFYANEFQ